MPVRLHARDILCIDLADYRHAITLRDDRFRAHVADRGEAPSRSREGVSQAMCFAIRPDEGSPQGQTSGAPHLAHQRSEAASDEQLEPKHQEGGPPQGSPSQRPIPPERGGRDQDETHGACADGSPELVPGRYVLEAVQAEQVEDQYPDQSRHRHHRYEFQRRRALTCQGVKGHDRPDGARSIEREYG
jgi:hypothetical protein